jgi:hypothetical protein
VLLPQAEYPSIAITIFLGFISNLLMGREFLYRVSAFFSSARDSKHNRLPAEEQKEV